MKEAATDKLFFKIGEVAGLASLKPSVLRFWESEFPSLQPQKSRSGQRLYSRRDLETVLEIKKLLYAEKLTIEGAKRKIGRKEQKDRIQSLSADESVQDVLLDIRTQLKEIRDSLA